MTSSSFAPPVHAGTKRPLAIDDQDEDVRIAVRALGDMRSMAVAHAHAPSAEAFAAAAKAHSRASSVSQSTPLLTHSSTSASTSNSSPVSPYAALAPDPPTAHDDLDVATEDFVSRVSHLPLVNTALKAYEHSKERSRVVKYGANFMENSVKTLSRPVIDRLPVGQLDDFACRQLDRFGYPKPITPESHSTEPANSALNSMYRDPLPLSSGTPSRAPSLAPSSVDDQQTSSPRPPLHRDVYDAPVPVTAAREEEKEQNDKQVATRSTWQAVLLEAGGIGAAVSEESMKRIQYCLQWLQYATAHIDSQILILRSFIDSLSPHPPHEHDPQALVPLQTMRSLTDVRRDVVSTIRQVVDVISRYAGGALPEPARASVRSFILRLPTRWAHANPDGSVPPAAGAAAQSPPASNSSSAQNGTGTAMGTTTTTATDSESTNPVPPRLRLRLTAGRGTHPTAGAATQAAQRVLTLAMESLDMMRSLAAVFKESLDRAEAWVERLRVVGIQRQGALPPAPSSRDNNTCEQADSKVPPPSPSPASSLSSSMYSLTSLSLAATQGTGTTSPPTSVETTQWSFRSENENKRDNYDCDHDEEEGEEDGADDDAEGETETEDEGMLRRRRRQQQQQQQQRDQAKSKIKMKRRGRARVGEELGMDVDA